MVFITMYFERKVYKKLLDWKKYYANNYAAMLEGAKTRWQIYDC